MGLIRVFCFVYIFLCFASSYKFRYSPISNVFHSNYELIESTVNSSSAKISHGKQGKIHAIIGYELSGKKSRMWNHLREVFQISDIRDCLMIPPIPYENSSKYFSSNSTANIYDRLLHINHSCLSTLVLIEPFVGLSYRQEIELIDRLIQLADEGHNVLLTTLPVRASICNHFDDISLLSERKLLYRGTCSEMASYFGSIGLPCPNHANPVKFYSSYGVVNYTSAESEYSSRQRVEQLEALFQRRCSREQSHQIHLRKIEQRTERKERLGNFLRNLLRKETALFPFNKASQCVAGLIGGCLDRGIWLKESVMERGQFVRRLHSLVWRQVAMDKRTNILRLLTSVALRLASAICGMSLQGMHVIPAAIANSLLTSSLAKASPFLVSASPPSEGPKCGTRSSSFFLTEIASKISLPSMYPCMHALLALDLGPAHATTSGIVTFLFVLAIRSLVGTLLRRSLPAMIPGAQISTVYSPAVLVMSRVVNLLSFYSSTSSPLAQTNLLRWLSRASNGMMILTVAQVRSSPLRLLLGPLLRSLSVLGRGAGPLVLGALQLQGASVLVSYLAVCAGAVCPNTFVPFVGNSISKLLRDRNSNIREKETFTGDDERERHQEQPDGHSLGSGAEAGPTALSRTGSRSLGRLLAQFRFDGSGFFYSASAGSELRGVRFVSSFLSVSATPRLPLQPLPSAIPERTGRSRGKKLSHTFSIPLSGQGRLAQGPFGLS